MNMKRAAMLFATVGLVTGMSAEAGAQVRLLEVLDQINVKNATLSGCIQSDGGALFLVRPNGEPVRLRGAKLDLERQIGRPAMVRGTTLLNMLVVQQVTAMRGTCGEPASGEGIAERSNAGAGASPNMPGRQPSGPTPTPTGSQQAPKRDGQVTPDELPPPSGTPFPTSGLPPRQSSTASRAAVPAGVNEGPAPREPFRAR